jgi:hypothetical protein
MAEYYAVLSKAVAGLDVNSPDSRRAVYDKARNALIGQLKAIDPPLPTAEISRQRLELEEAIRRVERETAVVPSGAPVRVARPAPAEPAVAASAPPPPPPPQQAPAARRTTPQDVFRRAIQDAERDNGEPALERAPIAAKTDSSWSERVERVPAPARPAQSYLPSQGYVEDQPSHDEPRLAPDYDHEWEQPAPDAHHDAEMEEAPPPKSRRGRRGPRVDDEVVERAPRSSRLPMIILVVLILAMLGGLAAFGWSQRDLVADLASGFGADSGTPPASQGAAAVVPAENAGGKDTGRLLEGGDAGGANDVRVVAPAADDPIGQQLASAPADAGTGAGDIAASAPQRAILYEEPLDAAAAAAGVVAINASVSWRYLQDGINGPEIVGNVDVPERALKLKIAIRRNTDETLPASHIVEVVVDAPADFPGGGVRDVPRVVFKPSEDARGQPLIGASARVADGFFWIALSGIEADVNLNVNLLRERVWIDVPLVYENGQRAILTLEKGAEGAQVFERALTAWTG